jgi:RNA polymerase sigma factor (sigma-70 family)
VSFAPEEEILALESNPVFLSEEEEQKELIAQALNKLVAKESLVLALFYLEDYSLDEICNITGWSLSNAKVILHRARKNIRSMLGSVIKSSSE